MQVVLVALCNRWLPGGKVEWGGFPLCFVGWVTCLGDAREALSIAA